VSLASGFFPFTKLPMMASTLSLSLILTPLRRQNDLLLGQCRGHSFLSKLKVLCCEEAIAGAEAKSSLALESPSQKSLPETFASSSTPVESAPAPGGDPFQHDSSNCTCLECQILRKVTRDP
jgi:hypothetical protein